MSPDLPVALGFAIIGGLTFVFSLWLWRLARSLDESREIPYP